MKTMRYFWCWCCGLCLCTLPLSSQPVKPPAKSPGEKVAPAIALKAFAFPLQDVVLTQGSLFHRAMQNDTGYLLSLKPDRLLHRFHANAGLPTRDSVYGGWESEGLSGHTLGHYLSACAMAWASTGDARFKQKVDYIVQELQRCQMARKTGYVGAIPHEDSIFGEVKAGIIRSSGFDLNGGWSPWYTVHKVMAGLADAWRWSGNRQALLVLEGMAQWADETLAPLSPAQLQQMLKCEYGGMNDLLAQLYAFTGHRKYLDLSYKFYDNFVMEPLSKGIDPLPGKHSNTNVPKAIGSAAQYTLTGNRRDSMIAAFFWDRMVHHHSYVIGGNSNYEYCGDPDKLSDRLSDNTCETCNTYNMLKLTRHLFAWQPDSRKADYYERALYNHILASQQPENGMMCYFVPLRMGSRKTFSDSTNTFTCCVGSGMENHVKYNESIYFEGSDGSLYVNLFIASTLYWRSRNMEIQQVTRFPEHNVTTLTIKSGKPAAFSVKVRKPAWLRNSAASFTVNGKPMQAAVNAEGYYEMHRRWANGDKLEVTLPMSLYAEAMPDNPDRIALLYGPVVLAGQLGDTMPHPVYGVPVLLTPDRKVDGWLKPVAGKPLHFQLQDGAAQPIAPLLKPFYATYQQYHTVYWDYFTPQQWQQRGEEYTKERLRLREIEEKTIDYFRVGEMQPERDHHLVATERSYVSDALGVMGREARSGHQFQFVMKVLPDSANILMLQYLGDDKNRKWDIAIDSTRLTTVEWNGGITGKFYWEAYPLPESLTRNKTQITVTVLANHGRTAGRVFGVRTVRP